MGDAGLLKMMIEQLKFTSIRVEGVKLRVELSFDLSMKPLKNWEEITLLLHRKQPSIFTVIINKHDIVVKAKMRNDGNWAPNIKVDNLE